MTDSAAEIGQKGRLHPAVGADLRSRANGGIIAVDDVEMEVDVDSDHIDEDGDGRTLRRTKNRQRVIVALLDLLRQGNIDPSVGDIADLAGVSHRSVFRYFDDINDLVRTAINYEVARAAPLAKIPDLGLGSLDRRVDSWVDSRLRVYDATYEVGRAARLKSAEIPSIDDGFKEIYQVGVTRMRNHFAPELDQLGTDGGFVLDAAMALTSFESYILHRRVMGHSLERIRQVWMRSLTILYRSNLLDQ